METEADPLEKMNEAAATAHTFKEATSVAASNLPESVRRTFKERIPSEAGVRYAPFEVLTQNITRASGRISNKGLDSILIPRNSY